MLKSRDLLLILLCVGASGPAMGQAEFCDPVADLLGYARRGVEMKSSDSFAKQKGPLLSSDDDTKTYASRVTLPGAKRCIVQQLAWAAPPGMSSIQCYWTFDSVTEAARSARAVMNSLNRCLRQEPWAKDARFNEEPRSGPEFSAEATLKAGRGAVSIRLVASGEEGGMLCAALYDEEDCDLLRSGDEEAMVYTMELEIYTSYPRPESSPP